MTADVIRSQIIRGQIIRGLISAGATRDNAQAITDTAVTAANDAIKTAYRTCRQAFPNCDGATAFTIAMQLLENELIPASIAAAESALAQSGKSTRVEIVIDTRQ